MKTSLINQESCLFVTDVQGLQQSLRKPGLPAPGTGPGAMICFPG